MQDLPTKGQFNHMCTKLQLWEQYYKKYILTFTYAKQKFKIFSAPGFFDIHHDNTHEKILAKSGCLKGNAWNLMNYIYFSFFQVLTQNDFEKVYPSTFPFSHRVFIYSREQKSTYGNLINPMQMRSLWQGKTHPENAANFLKFLHNLKRV